MWRSIPSNDVATSSSPPLKPRNRTAPTRIATGTTSLLQRFFADLLSTTHFAAAGKRKLPLSCRSPAL